MDRKIDMLKRILDESKYTVALCGSGIMEEAGFVGLKNQNRAYEIEKKYNDSPEEIFTSVYYTTRPEKFFEFYKKELLEGLPGPTESGAALAAMEREGKLQYMITANIYEQGQRAGCHNVINLHGSVYKNKCLHCGREYSMEYVRDAKGIPVCRCAEGRSGRKWRCLESWWTAV